MQNSIAVLTFLLLAEITLFWVNLVQKLKVVSLIDSNGIRTHNHFIRKRTLNHLAKLAKRLSCVVSTYLYGEIDFKLKFGT